MARRSNKKSRRGISKNPTANRRLPSSYSWTQTDLTKKHYAKRSFANPFGSLGDRRFFHPLGAARPLAVFKARQSPVFQQTSRPQKLRQLFSPKSTLAFSQPERVMVCVRRRMRTEILHAFKKTGKSGQRRPRRNFLSNISCRRK